MTTNYSKIAASYDNNPLRKKQIDPEIAGMLKSQSSLTILDLACGTGNYLQTQREAYSSDPIQWFGQDNSESMLNLARKKNPEAFFFCADATESPKEIPPLDYIRNDFAFHHFPDKEKVLDRVKDSLKPGGLLAISNICPEYMRYSWVYNYFPASKEIDQNRFASCSQIYGWLSERGFSVDLQVHTSIYELDLAARIEEVKNRDMSQLNLIDENQYQQGLKKMKQDALDGKSILADFALLQCRAIKHK